MSWSLSGLKPVIHAIDTKSHCAHVVAPADADRLVSLARSFSTLIEESPIIGDSVDLLTTGINMSRGRMSPRASLHQQDQNLRLQQPGLNTETRFFRRNGFAARLPQLELRHPEYSHDNLRKQALPPRNPLDERQKLYDVRMEVPGKALVIAADDEEGRFLDVPKDIAKALRIRFKDAPRLAA